MQVFYHINNNPECNWKVGDEIIFGVDDNHMWQSFARTGDFIELNGTKYTSDLITRNALDVYMGQAAPIPMKDYHFKPIYTLKEALDSLGNSVKIIREQAFESIRKEFYSELPSRNKCIWLIPNDALSFSFWKNTLYSINQRIFKLAVDGKIHRAAQKWLVGGTYPLSEINSMAHRYWKGEDSGGIEDEVLFTGKIKILEEIR